MNTKPFQQRKNLIQVATLLHNCAFQLVRMRDYEHSSQNYQANMQELEDCSKCLIYWWEWLDINMHTQIFQVVPSPLLP